jgi:protein-L-isoaspartate(D-aspartate) O-methyltransferase
MAVALSIAPAAGIRTAAGDDTQRARDGMVEDVLAMWRLTQREVGGSAPDRKVIDVLAKVPRHEFVPHDARSKAYANRPLPIGLGQTISQPYIVALMTDLVDVGEQSRVFEIGTGSGYQAAVLAEIAGEVYTMEIIEPLAESAAKRLERLGYENVRVRHGDGYYGWKEHAPFDAIVVTAAVSHVPPPLVEQLAVGGKMVIPVGSGFAVQQLVLVEKHAADRIVVKQMLPVRFVPLTGSH